MGAFTLMTPTHAVGRVAALMTRTTAANCNGSLDLGLCPTGIGRNGISRCGTDTRPQRPHKAEGQENLFSSQCPRPGNPAGATGISWQRSRAAQNRAPEGGRTVRIEPEFGPRRRIAYPASVPAKKIRRALALALVLGLMLPLGPSWAHHANPPGPVHAGNTFGWYPAAARHEFVGPLSGWRKSGKGDVRNKNGMLTITSARTGSVAATLTTAGRASGRWEIRLKARRWSTALKNPTVRAELIPAGDRKQYCGARNISLGSHTMSHPRVKFYIHTLPNLAFRAAKGIRFGGDRWHTLAVEVTPTRISWFVDAHVVATERRPEALSGVPMTMRISINGVKGARMNRTRVQLDWARYWTLAKPNDKSVRAPAPTQGTYRKACPPA